MRVSFLPVFALGLCGLLSACSTQSIVTKGMADALATQSSAAEDDLQLAREASAFYLKLSESVLLKTPAHTALATSVTGGFTQYAYAFVAFEAEKLETQDVKAALLQRQRAARLYERAKQHGMRALTLQQPGLPEALATDKPVPLRAEQVGLAYWTAAAWAASISLSKDQPDRVADLPQVLRLAQAADALAPHHDEGAIASLLGTLEASRPGGSVGKASAYFARAAQSGAGRNAGVYVAEAEALALPAGDRPRFESLLQQALQISQTHRNLSNEVMRERAQWLFNTLDDRF
ncbi:TRAP transporter T-component [Comamonadaceae bacterium]